MTTIEWLEELERKARSEAEDLWQPLGANAAHRKIAKALPALLAVAEAAEGVGPCPDSVIYDCKCPRCKTAEALAELEKVPR